MSQCERATEYSGKCGARLTAPKGRAQTEKQHHGGGANRGAFGDAAGRPADLFAADQRCGQRVRNRVLRLAHIRPRLPRGVVRDGQGEGRRGLVLLPQVRSYREQTTGRITLQCLVQKFEMPRV